MRNNIYYLYALYRNTQKRGRNISNKWIIENGNGMSHAYADLMEILGLIIFAGLRLRLLYIYLLLYIYSLDIYLGYCMHERYA